MNPRFRIRFLMLFSWGRAPHIGVFSSPSREDREKTSDAIEMMGIGHLAERPYTKISGGERQLVLIARGIAQDAPVMVLDEPTSHLDLKKPGYGSGQGL